MFGRGLKGHASNIASFSCKIPSKFNVITFGLEHSACINTIQQSPRVTNLIFVTSKVALDRTLSH